MAIKWLSEEIFCNNVDAIEVSGVIKLDDEAVEVNTEDCNGVASQFYSTYIHREHEGVICVGDFDTKEEAVAFGCGLAFAAYQATGVFPEIYGNCTDIQKYYN